MIAAIMLIPALGGAIALLIPSQQRALLRLWGLVTSGATLVLAASMVVTSGVNTVGHDVSYTWLQSPWPVNVHFAVDGLNLYLVGLTALIAFLSIGALSTQQDRPNGLMGLLLLLEASTLGMFMAADLVAFYIFWDLMLIPSFLLLLGWGGPERRQAATRYIVYNGAGGLLMLLGIVAVGVYGKTLDIGALAGVGGLAPGGWNTWTTWAFLGIVLGFAIKVPVFPFHAWMPATYQQSPAPVAAFLSGVQSKAGIYGFLRIALPLFPGAAKAFGPLLAGLALCGVIYGALIALAQREGRSLLAFSSLSHLGLVAVAVAALAQVAGTDAQALDGALPAAQGAVVQMVAHGLCAGGLFLIFGMLERRVGRLELAKLGGLAARMPVLAAAFLVVSMAALGLPGLAGFAGEFMMLLGIASANMTYAVIALFAVIVAAYYMLRLYQGLMQGPLPLAEAKASTRPRGRRGNKRDADEAPDMNADFAEVRDVSWREALVLVPIVVLVIWLGIRPAPIAQAVAPVIRGTAVNVMLMDAGLASPEPSALTTPSTQFEDETNAVESDNAAAADQSDTTAAVSEGAEQ